MAQNLKINILAKDKTKAALNGVRGRLAGLKNAVFSLKGAFVGLGAGLVIKSFVSTGRSVEDLQVRLKQLFGSTQEGAKAFDVMSKFAAKVPFSLEQIQAASGNLAVVAGDADRLSKILEITGNVAAVTGLDFNVAAEQIQRSFAGGIAAADIFREKGVRDMLGFKAGATVTAEDTIKAFEKVFGKGGRFGGATKELATTFTGTLSMLGDKYFNFKKNVADAQFFDTLKKEFKDLNDFIEENADSFEAIADTIGFVLAGAVKLLSLAIKGVAKAVGIVRDAYESLIGVLNKIPGIKIDILTRKERDLLREIKKHDEHMMNIRLSNKKLEGSLVKQKTITEEISELNDKTLKKLTNVAQQLFSLIDSSIKSISKSIAESIVLGKNLADAFRGFLQQILIKVLSTMIEIAAKIALQVFLEKTQFQQVLKRYGLELKILDTIKKQNAAKSSGSSGSIKGSLINFAFSKFFDKGGAVSKGNPVVVGERGPELFVPNQTGQITQNARGVGGSPVNVNFTINAIDTRGFQEALVQNRGVISNIINDAVNERGAKNLI